MFAGDPNVGHFVSSRGVNQLGDGMIDRLGFGITLVNGNQISGFPNSNGSGDVLQT